MKKKTWKKLVAVALAVMTVASLTACSKSGKSGKAEISPDTPAKEVAFPLAEKKELSFITWASSDSTQNPNERAIFQRLEE